MSQPELVYVMALTSSHAVSFLRTTGDFRSKSLRYIHAPCAVRDVNGNGKVVWEDPSAIDRSDYHRIRAACEMAGFTIKSTEAYEREKI